MNEKLERREVKWMVLIISYCYLTKCSELRGRKIGDFSGHNFHFASTRVEFKRDIINYPNLLFINPKDMSKSCN